VRLADFGVSASCWGSQDWSKHRTFIGTPCWMAPEVMDQQSGYAVLPPSCCSSSLSLSF